MAKWLHYYGTEVVYYMLGYCQTTWGRTSCATVWKRFVHTIEGKSTRIELLGTWYIFNHGREGWTLWLIITWNISTSWSMARILAYMERYNKITITYITPSGQTCKSGNEHYCILNNDGCKYNFVLVKWFIFLLGTSKLSESFFAFSLLLFPLYFFIYLTLFSPLN